MAPQVQTLDEILAQLESAYAPTRDIYNKQAALIPARFDTQRTALEGAKNKNFDAIATQANRAGMGFTGFTANEQANYLSDKYLPGVQDTYTQQEDAGLGIAKSLASLDAEKRLKAMDTRTNQETSLNTFRENERQRAFQAEQARLQIAADNARAARSAAAAPKASTSLANEYQKGIQLIKAGSLARASDRLIAEGLNPADFQDEIAAANKQFNDTALAQFGSGGSAYKKR